LVALAKEDLEEFKDENTLKFDPWIYGENVEEDLESIASEKGDKNG
jgi:hypothetical protein